MRLVKLLLAALVSAGLFAPIAASAGNTSSAATVATSTDPNAGWAPVGITTRATDLPVGRQMIEDLTATGNSPANAVNYAQGYIESGATVPITVQWDLGKLLKKIVPAGTTPSAYTGYWTTVETMDIELRTPAKLTQRFALPPSQASATSFDIYQIQAAKSVRVFQSKVAPTIDTVTGLKQTGGAEQTMVMDRAAFSQPVKVGAVNVK